IIDGTVDEIEAAGKRGAGLVGVPTGFTELDQLTNGLHPGQMIVIAARPAMGKSTLGIDIVRAASIKHNMTSAVFSLEMSRNEITMRVLSSVSKYKPQRQCSGTLDIKAWQMLA